MERREDDREAPHIKEEQEVEPLTAQACEKQEETDTKDSMFNIIYVQRSDEEGRHLPHQNQIVKNKEGDLLPGSSSQPVKEGASEDDGGLHCDANKNKPQSAGETADRPYTCSVCNKNFRIKSILTRHMKTHTGEKPYSCSVCGKSFIQRSYLQTHMNSHSGQKPYRCSFLLCVFFFFLKHRSVFKNERSKPPVFYYVTFYECFCSCMYFF
uniref:C2H2-type domain-containing protein n=1 Tax=Amphiprion percula TaxID=161767 RepID=A0A3P8S8S0_AMPPE